MKKKLINAAIALTALLTAGTAMAQQPREKSNNRDLRSKKELACCKQDSLKCQATAYNPFEGLNLTEAQQSKLDALKAERRARMEKAGKDNKQQKDSLKAQGRQNRLDAKKSYLMSIKEILTPEQYVQFLENAYLNPAPAKGMRAQGPKGMKPGKDGKKGMKPGKGQRPDKQKDNK